MFRCLIRRVLMLLLGCALAGGALAGPGTGLPIPLREAQVQLADDPQPVTVALPDTWGARHRKTVGSATYRLPFDLAAVPAAGLTARFTRISSTRRVTLNGFPLGNETFVGNEHGIPDLLSLPAPMLRAGRTNSSSRCATATAAVCRTAASPTPRCSRRPTRPASCSTASCRGR